MTLKELLDHNNYLENNLAEYIKNCGGIQKVKKKDLEKILREFNYWPLREELFKNTYKIVSDIENGKVIKVWTWVAGIATVASTIFTILNYFQYH